MTMKLSRTMRAPRAKLMRLLAATSAVLMTIVGLVAVGPVSPASAISGSEFNAGYIISDAEFYNSNAMTEAQIQSFLNAQVGTCQSKLNRCLNVLLHTTASRAKLVSDSTGNVRCEAFQGGASLKASTIIYRVQKACGISAKVILVTLQKEQGLVQKTDPSVAALDRAMGYACPDTAPCAATSLGFGNQVYMGALQLKTYKASKFGMQPGNHSIAYSPTAACGSSTFNIQNYATAALYNYTPYRPNAKALANLTGTGDSCSSYGNRNFWVYYYNWFGSPTAIRPVGVSVSRIGGADRYDVSVGVSAANFPTTAPVVYVATGTNFPDALNAAPAAAKLGGPLLLVRPTLIPPAVKAEIQRLKPALIVVAGGPASVSNAVLNQLKALAPTVHRDGGADRYEVSRNVTTEAFPAGSPVAYIATGQTFPDALSASGAAGAIGAPVILVRGTEPTIDPATRALLVKLGVTKVIIAGGPASVNPGIEADLKVGTTVTSVERFGGADRYIVSGGINRDAFSASGTVYIASGKTFPDALSGAPIAGAQHAPLYVIPSNCIPKYVLEDIVALKATKMVILGGTGTVTTTVNKFAQCT